METDRAFRIMLSPRVLLPWATMAWDLTEAVEASSAGMVARSLAVIGF